MKQLKPLIDFFEGIKDNPYIGCSHIALYTALFNLWASQGCNGPVVIFSYTIMPKAKIAGLGTYHKVIKELDRFGYISYKPALNRKGSIVHLQLENEINSRCTS